MKKIFSFVLVAMAAMAVNATDVVFDFTNPSSLNPAVTPSETASQGIQLGGTAYTAGDVTLTFAAPSNNGAKLWTNTNGTYELRFYQPNSFTISSKGENIKAVRFSFSDKGAITPATGEIDGTNTWLGDASEITFNVPEKGTASKIKTITVSLGEAPVISTDTLDVKAAIALIAAAPDKKLNKDMYVRGRVTGIDNSGAEQYGNINVWLADITGSTDTIEAYRMKSFDGAKYKDASEIQFGEGDTIVFYSAEWSYYAAGKVYEGFGCSLVKVYGKGNPKPIEYEVINVAKAVELGEALEEGGKTTDKYAVRGYVVSSYDFDTEHSNQTFYMSDEMTGYGPFCAKWTTGDVVATITKDSEVTGDFVEVVGQIEKYQGKIQILRGVCKILSHSDIVNVKAANKANKFFDGKQVVFEVNGVQYNVLGNIVK